MKYSIKIPTLFLGMTLLLGCEASEELTETSNSLRASDTTIDFTVPTTTEPDYQCVDWGQITYKNTIKELTEKYCRKCHAAEVSTVTTASNGGVNPNAEGYAVAPKGRNFNTHAAVASAMYAVFSETRPMPPPQSEEPIEEGDLERIRIWLNGEDGNEITPDGLDIPEISISYAAYARQNIRLTYAVEFDNQSSNPTIAVFYDNDREGFDGTLLQECITAVEPGRSLSIDSSDVRAGTYYLYACIFDGDNVTCNYSANTVTVPRRFRSFSGR